MTRKRHSLSRVLADLRQAFLEGGIEPLHQAHLAARSRSFRYRLLYGFANLLLPINPLFDIVKDIDRQVETLGIAAGSDAILRRLPIPWEQRIASSEARTCIQRTPVIVFGKHGSVLTPLLVAAALDRTDAKMIGANYIARLGPQIGAHTFSVFVSTPLTVRRAGREGLIPRLLGWITSRLAPPLERAEAKARNRAALDQATDYVLQGGALLIAPDPREPGGAWRRGIGVIIASLAHSGARACQIPLVPYRIWNASISGIFHLLSRNPILRACGRRRFRDPIRIEFGEPLRISDVVEETGSDPAAITAHLEQYYQALGY